MNISNHNLQFLAICTFRYSLGRQSSAPGDCADFLVEYWLEIPKPAQSIIKRELEQAFVDEEESVLRWADLTPEEKERRTTRYKPLGDRCDIEQWGRVRALWRAGKNAE